MGRSLPALDLACNRSTARGGGRERPAPPTGLTLLRLVGGRRTAVPPQLAGPILHRPRVMALLPHLARVQY